MSTPGYRKTAVVLVMAESDPVLTHVQPHLDQLDVALTLAATLQDFQQRLWQRPPADVVITGVSLPDGNWCDVLTSTVRRGSTARVLVCCLDADERFWSEAIWRGVHDVLVVPFSGDFLQRCVDTRGPSGRQEADSERDHEEDERWRISEVEASALLLPAVT